MAANTAADALGRFLSSTPEASTVVGPTPNPGVLMDRLGSALVSAGETGLPLVEAMAVSQLPRPDFFNALTQALGLNLVESFDNAGVQSVRLTPTGRSLY